MVTVIVGVTLVALEGNGATKVTPTHRSRPRGSATPAAGRVANRVFGASYVPAGLGQEESGKVEIVRNSNPGQNIALVSSPHHP